MTTEAERIVKEYARREKAIPSDFYSLTRTASLYVWFHQFRNLVQLLNKQRVFPLDNSKILDVGCGGGRWLWAFVALGAEQRNMAGIDLLPARVEQASKILPNADIRVGDAGKLPWDNSSFDIVLQATVFTSILDTDMKKNVAAEMLRVLKKDGIIIWHDFRYNNPRNPNVRGVGKKEIFELFPESAIKLKSMVLAPPIARRIVRISWVLGLLLEKIPLLRTHYIGVIRKNV